jgi:hypothetical protein
MTEKVFDYSEIDASALVDAGVLDVVRGPIDAVDHHPDIPWGRIANVVIQASYFEKANSKTPRHHLMVNFKKRTHHKPVPFAIGQQEDGNYSIATVAGYTAGLAELNDDQSTIMAELLMKSLSKKTSDAD